MQKVFNEVLLRPPSPLPGGPQPLLQRRRGSGARCHATEAVTLQEAIHLYTPFPTLLRSLFISKMQGQLFANFLKWGECV